MARVDKIGGPARGAWGVLVHSIISVASAAANSQAYPTARALKAEQPYMQHCVVILIIFCIFLHCVAATLELFVHRGHPPLDPFQPWQQSWHCWEHHKWGWRCRRLCWFWCPLHHKSRQPAPKRRITRRRRQKVLFCLLESGSSVARHNGNQLLLAHSSSSSGLYQWVLFVVVQAMKLL